MAPLTIVLPDYPLSRSAPYRPVITAWDALFDHKWLWVRYTETLTDLYSISDDLEYQSAKGTLTSDDLDKIYDRIQLTLSETNAEWKRKRAQQKLSENGNSDSATKKL